MLMLFYAFTNIPRRFFARTQSGEFYFNKEDDTQVLRMNVWSLICHVQFILIFFLKKISPQYPKTAFTCAEFDGRPLGYYLQRIKIEDH